MDDSQKLTTIISLWKLASQQIYSRFGAMLTANSIIIAAIVLMITGRIALNATPFVWLGISLCVLWILFNALGICTEKRLMDKARTLVHDSEIVPNASCSLWHYGYTPLSFLTILVFIFIYIFLLIQ